MKRSYRNKSIKLTIYNLILFVLLAGLFSCSSPVSTATGSPYQSVSAPTDFSTAVAELLPSVVSIEVKYGPQGAPGSPSSSGGAGTGWVFDTGGHIVTNNHVVESAQSIRVVLPDGSKYTPTAIKADSQNDLAVLKINANNLKPAALGDSSKLVLGEPVAALGNALNLGIHVTAGIVSSLDMSITVNNIDLSGLIETDATINPGNSGGILFTLEGEVVGIPNAGVDDPQIDPENLGYAISINTALPVINKLISQMP